METSDMVPQTPAPRAAGLKIGPVSGLILALVAGGIAWAAIDKYYPVFKVAKEFEVPNIGAPQEEFIAHNAAKQVVDRKNSALFLGGFATLTAVAIALGEAIARRSILPPLVAAPVAATFGAVAGLAGALAHEYMVATVGRPEIVHTIGEQALMLGVFGVAVGLALGAVARPLRSIAAVCLGGAVAGALAGAVYPLAMSIFMPAVNTESLIPTASVSRIVWIGSAAGLVGLCIPWSARQREVAVKPTG